jgi:hypothetical protein
MFPPNKEAVRWKQEKVNNKHREESGWGRGEEKDD